MKVTHLNGLRAFEATVRTGNFRAAADELGVTPAAVGQQVRGLEEYLECKLFYRTSTGVEPTALALEVAGKLTSSFSVINDVLFRLKEAHPGNRLSLSMTQSFAENWLTYRLGNFYSFSEQVDLRIDTTHRLVDLTDDEFDFAIRFGPDIQGAINDTPLISGCVVPVCSPDFAKRYKLQPGQNSIENIPLCHLKDETSDPGWLNWQSWSERYGIEYDATAAGPQFSRLSSGLRVAKSGLGLVLCGMIECFNSLRDGSLIMPFGPETACRTEYSYRLLSARSRTLTKVQKQFKIWVEEQAKEYETSVARILSGQDR
ncbi:LysR family transcriptional regulator [Candidatus Pacearchaeota archaeon]|nr:LysR family transcriptional regulator [Candidatus Pacearchaeota archaeon]